jgi:putative endonuclease
MGTAGGLVRGAAGADGSRPGGGPAGPGGPAGGAAAEDRALRFLLGQGLALVQRNFRVARGPRARGGEIDLILRDRDGTLVFVEVRQRSTRLAGGAAASVSLAKQRSLVLAAQHYLQRLPRLPPCRFDVVAIDGEHLQWLPAAFDAGVAAR